jgi:uncharacterized protein YaaW (UPF0174 family)
MQAIIINNKLTITGNLYKKIEKGIKDAITAKIKETRLITNNLFLQALISSLHNLARINPAGNPANSNNR